jgi:uncharacterized protein YigA (DUF484 family)
MSSLSSLSSPSNEIQVILAKLANLRERQKRIESEIQRFGLINITDEAIYKKVQKLQDRMNKIKNTLEVFKNDAKCNKQCENIRITKDKNSVDDFLLDLVLKSAEPLEPLSLAASAPPEE